MKPAAISIVNRKGGVGKTTLAIALADALVSEHQSDCAIIDLDPQASASQALQPDEQFLKTVKSRHTLAELLDARIKDKAIELEDYRVGMVHRIKDRAYVDCDLYPNGDRFWDLEIRELRSDGGKRLALEISKLIRELRKSGKVVIIDCPPGQSTSALAAIRASDMVLCPITPDKFAIWGKTLLSAYIRKYARGKAPKFIVSRSQLTGNDVKMSIQELAGQDEMLQVETGETEHGIYGRLAPFSNRQSVKKRIQMEKFRTLQNIYSNTGAHELRNIINAISRELEATDGR